MRYTYSIYYLLDAAGAAGSLTIGGMTRSCGWAAGRKRRLGGPFARHLSRPGLRPLALGCSPRSNEDPGPRGSLRTGRPRYPSPEPTSRFRPFQRQAWAPQHGQKASSPTAQAPAPTPEAQLIARGCHSRSKYKSRLLDAEKRLYRLLAPAQGHRLRRLLSFDPGALSATTASPSPPQPSRTVHAPSAVREPPSARRHPRATAASACGHRRRCRAGRRQLPSRSARCRRRASSPPTPSSSTYGCPTPHCYPPPPRMVTAHNAMHMLCTCYANAAI